MKSNYSLAGFENGYTRIELSHEASVGMISKDELAYLMASGTEEEKARSLIIEGLFLLLHQLNTQTFERTREGKM